MYKIIVYTIIFLVSYCGVEIFRRWSLRRNLLDIPNERSSHTKPTPRGGGIIIVVVCLLSYLLYSNFISGDFRRGYFLSAIFVALVSGLDDIFKISSIWRFLIHSISALIIILSQGYFDKIYLPVVHHLELGVFGAILTFFWIVCMTNAYNFMDGIDGIAGMQAVTAGIGWLIIGEMQGFNGVGFYGGVIAFASLGFLIHNWQPARIFMGDVGSAFLGFTFSVLPLMTFIKQENVSSLMPVVAVGVVLLFVLDTFITFFRRVLVGERVWEAHRRHFYQQLVIKGFSHRSVTLFYSSISIVIIILIIVWLKITNSAG